MTERSGIVAVVPVFGDISHLEDVLGGLGVIGVSPLVVNDGMGEPLSSLLTSLDVPYIELPTNQGVGAATTSGVQHAISLGYEGVITVDADGAHDIASVAAILGAAKQNALTPILANRFSSVSQRFIPDEKLSANGFATALVEIVTGIRSLSDTMCGLRYYPGRLAGFLGSASVGYSFIPSTLPLMVSEKARVVDVLVDYRGGGPWYTSAIELGQLLRWAAFRASEIPGFGQLLRDVHQLDFEHVIAIKEDLWRFVPLPSRESWIIAGPPPRCESIQRPLIPGRPISVGIIPDGGRRWARREEKQLVDAYRLSLGKVSSLVSTQSMTTFAVYCLSEANLARTAAELLALFDAVETMVGMLRADGVRPVLWGDLDLLPQDRQQWALAENLRTLQESGRLCFVAFAYSSRWEESVFTRDGQPWRYGLGAEILQMAISLRFSVILRSGGACTLSDFMPSASSYAAQSIRQELFNDIDLDGWFQREMECMPTLKWGV